MRRIPIKNYEGYQLDVDKLEIFSNKSNRNLKPVKGMTSKSYEFSINGVKEIVPLFKILLENWEKIREFSG